MAKRMLTISKIVDRRMWHWEHPFRQFDGFTHEILNKLEAKDMNIDRLRELDHKEIGKDNAESSDKSFKARDG